MAKINGVVKDHEGKIIENAEVLFVDRAFNVLASGYSNEDGEYYLQINEKTNGMVMGTFSYGEEYLAFTFDNISTHIPHRIDIRLGNVEFIKFKRGIPKERDRYVCSFQLVSLPRMIAGNRHLSPDASESSLQFLLDDKMLTGYQLTKEKTAMEDRGDTIDSYTLSFESDVKDRGKVLQLIYKTKDSYGILKSYV